MKRINNACMSLTLSVDIYIYKWFSSQLSGALRLLAYSQ